MSPQGIDVGAAASASAQVTTGGVVTTVVTVSLVAAMVGWHSWTVAGRLGVTVVPNTSWGERLSRSASVGGGSIAAQVSPLFICSSSCLA